MPSIVGKRRGNQTYYYLVESARVDGKPRIVSQQYLGSAEEVTAKLAGQAGQPVRSQHKRFGDVAAVWSMLDGLDVVGLVDDVLPRYANAGASVGTYLALATLNRVVDPRSKRAFADWWATTAAPRWVKVDAAALDHRRFWDAMDLLSTEDLRAIETSVYGAMIDRYGLDLASVALDMTNFATYIDSTNDRAPRNAPTCGWSPWPWWSPVTAASRSSPTRMPATARMSPSSPSCWTNWSAATGCWSRVWTR